jgi:hypothetical protein
MLKRAALLLVSVTVGCGSAPDLTPPDCVTACGLRLYAVGRGVPAAESADCAGLQRAEDLALETFGARVDGWGYETTCPALAGWRVYLVDRELNEHHAYMNPYRSGELINGQTFCGYGFADVNTQDWFGTSALIHEMAHMIERCNDPTHTTWGVRGIYDAITEARSTGWLQQRGLVAP